MILELNMFNMCKRPHHQEDYDNENEEIDIIEPIIEEHIEDENFTNSIEIFFADSVESSKELNCDTANICSILDSVQVPISDDDQSNFEDMTQSEEPNEDEAPELELKPLPEELKYAYLREQQTYLVVISSQLTHDQEAPMMQPPDWSLPFELMCDASNYVVGAVLGQRNEDKLPYDWSSQDKKKFLTEVQSFYWDDPYMFKYCSDQNFQRCISNDEIPVDIRWLIEAKVRLTERQLHLVYEEGDRGLSKLVSETASVRGSQVLDIIPKALNL
ncbi:hypothetical protein WN943_018722 [Citrus x changshan-huyou]